MIGMTDAFGLNLSRRVRAIAGSVLGNVTRTLHVVLLVESRKATLQGQVIVVVAYPTFRVSSN